MTLRTLNHGSYGISPVLGQCRFISSTVLISEPDEEALGLYVRLLYGES